MKSLGRNPKGALLKKIEASSHYRDHAFHNLVATEQLLPGTSFLNLAWKMMNKPANTIPPHPLPVVKTDLRALPGSDPLLVWFGHSSYLLRIRGKIIVVDPVFSPYASPFRFGPRSFPLTTPFTADDLPDIDVLILTHDHYDHLDYRTIQDIQGRVKKIVTSLGVSSHLDFWDIRVPVQELDWWDSLAMEGEMTLTATPARHFSGRTFKRNQTLWSSFVLETGKHRLFLGGDSGYGTHFKTIAGKFGPFDLAILEAGQYNDLWPFIHMRPEEAVQASLDLGARWMLPVHWGGYSLALHSWDDPAVRVSKKAKELSVNITTPMIGQPVILDRFYPNDEWWKSV